MNPYPLIRQDNGIGLNFSNASAAILMEKSHRP
jgi:hypothetical protein